jgi:hypothetical protein
MKNVAAHSVRRSPVRETDQRSTINDQRQSTNNKRQTTDDKEVHQ